ncbi:uncharacterized protein LOC126892068 [Diabrotica virgifera virgifera]|uniref:Uncharacterized protein n=1 Tax=Diabrotica virgifera virgifera TaxID=50390 RepID=A0ABM5L4U3_DIAVI|nr:uncharacterized protein LOC126892068 [Diabrotica virgifera virgifera]
MEQFATFMGHTKKTHESYYRLPQDLYQTAKVAKLLIAVNSGQVAKYKGKSLDEITLSDNESLLDETEAEKPLFHDQNINENEIEETWEQQFGEQAMKNAVLGNYLFFLIQNQEFKERGMKDKLLCFR